MFVLYYSRLSGCPGTEYWVLVSVSGMFIWGLVCGAWIIFSNFWMRAFHCNCKIVILIQPCPSATTGTSSPWSWALAFAKETVKLWTVQRTKPGPSNAHLGLFQCWAEVNEVTGEGKPGPSLCFGWWKSGEDSHQLGCPHFSLRTSALIF